MIVEATLFTASGDHLRIPQSMTATWGRAEVWPFDFTMWLRLSDQSQLVTPLFRPSRHSFTPQPAIYFRTSWPAKCRVRDEMKTPDQGCHNVLPGQAFSFYFLLMGWDWVHLVLRPLFGLLYQPRMIDDGECGAVGGMRIGGGIRSTRRKSVPNASLSITYPTWPDPGSNPGRCCGKPETNRLSYGTATWSGLLRSGGAMVISKGNP
jgi:hypothetical protein